MSRTERIADFFDAVADVCGALHQLAELLSVGIRAVAEGRKLTLVLSDADTTFTISVDEDDADGDDWKRPKETAGPC